MDTMADLSAPPILSRDLPTSVSLFFPVYKDEPTVREVTGKAVRFLEKLGVPFEVIVIDDGSPDRAGAIADELASADPRVRVIHHPRNLGYGAAIRSGLAAARYESIWFTDGDDQFEIEDFRKLLRVLHSYDLVITFRYRKIYPWTRLLISWAYNVLVRRLFGVRFRDISTALRIVRREVVEDIKLTSVSPFIGAELAIKAQLKGYRVGEVGIQTFDRLNGPGSATSWRNIIRTIREVFRARREIFSFGYDLPEGRPRTSGHVTSAPPPPS